MIAPVKWIKQYCDLPDNISIGELASKMTHIGTAVEDVKTIEGSLSGVSVAIVDKADDFAPKAGMKLLTLSAKSGIKRILTTSTCVKAGQKVCYAAPGAVMPDVKTVSSITIEGTVSEGMICSAEDLKLKPGEVDEASIFEDGLVLFENANIGDDVNELLMREGLLLDIEVGANRPDCLSMEGVAREAALAAGSEFKPIEGGYSTSAECSTADAVTLDVQDKEDCPAIVLRVVRNVKIAPSPKWMRERLIAAGVRPISNIVDLTNYVMLETGQPIHSYDLDKLSDASDGRKRITVRLAKEGESVTTLDGIERPLTPEMLVIADEKNPIGLAGIMGGESSKISDETKNVVFEIAAFRAAKIRRGTRIAGLNTEASMRYNKGVSTANPYYTMNRLMHYIDMLKIADIADDFVSDGNINPESAKVDFTLNGINKILGTELKMDDFITELRREELDVTADEEKGSIVVPWFRQDISIEADIAEEVARLVGYDTIPEKVVTYQNMRKLNWHKEDIKDAARDYFTINGYSEAVTYSFIGAQEIEKLHMDVPAELERSISIINPLGEDTRYMRTQMVSSLLNVYATNQRRKRKDIRMFEIGSVYLNQPPVKVDMPLNPEGAQFDQQNVLAFVAEGSDFFDFKADVDGFIKMLGCAEPEYTAVSAPYYQPGRAAKVFSGDVTFGTFGAVHPDVLKNFDISGRLFFAELKLSELKHAAPTEIMRFKPFTRMPAIERDVALIVDKKYESASIIKAIKASAGDILESVELFDVYEGSPIPMNMRSLGYKLTFRAFDRTLSSEEVDDQMRTIITALGGEYHAKLRDK